MDRVRAERVAELFDRALALPVEERHGLLEAVHLEDAELAAELESLLTAHQEPGGLDDLAARVLPGLLDDLSRALAAETEQPRDIGRYEVLDRLGRGGMGEVVLARDRTLDRLVALKFLPAHLATHPEARARLMREARAASALDHPNIAVVFEIGTTEPAPDGSAEGRLYIAMGYYAGDTIKQMLARGALPITRAVDYALQTAAGLAAAHHAGIVHRDIKPANLIITDRGELKILDFGVAKLAGVDVTKEGATLGTIAYMSPEQTRGGPVDARTDLWSLGVVLYEMLTGIRPFPAEDGAVLLQAIRHDRHRPIRQLRPDVPEALERLIDRCLRKEPDERYPTADALRAELQGMDAKPTASASARSFGSRPAMLAVAALVLATGVVGGLILRRGGEAAGAMSGGSMTIAVLPFTAAAPDSALERIGRDLAVAVASALDGIEDLRTVDPLVVAAHATTGASGSSPERGPDLARAVGAGRLLQGTLTRSGASVRVDARLTGATEPGVLAGVAVTADQDDLVALTDAVTLGLLRSLWRGRPVVSPSLGAIRTTSVAALRAYLEGEERMAGSDMPRAVEAFERAFAIDSTYWFAYWRSLYPRRWFPSGAADTALVRQVIEHRHEFPEQDRVLVESWMAGRLTDRLRILRDAIKNFDSYWPAWYAYGVQLVHNGPSVGTTLEDARAALERTLELNPDFSSAWDRLGWVITAQRDTAAMTRVLSEVTRTTAAVDFRGANLRHARVFTGLIRSGLPSADSLERIVDWLFSESEPLITFFTTLPVAGGHARIQLGINAAILSREPGPRVASAVWAGNALSWVSRGAWDSALVAMDRAAAVWPEPRRALYAYGLAVTGASLGLSPVAEAVRRRPVAPGRGSEWSAEDLAEVQWLDGILAHARNDPAGLARARAALRESTARYAAALRGSLAALAVDAAGDRARAARDLARLEWDNADRSSPPPLSTRYPFLVPVNRLLAARWLRQLGDDGEAVRLLSWADGLGDSWVTALKVTFGWIGFVDRAEAAASMGQPDRARLYYTRFLERHDLPGPALLPLVERARAGLARIPEAPPEVNRPGTR